jgi:hypothetical protein
VKYEPRLDLDDPVLGSMNDRENLEWEQRPKTAEELWAYRNKLFGSAEMKETVTMIDNFRAAYEAKDNLGLFDEMELAERYWSGDFGVPEDFDDPGSNTNIINTNVETQVASMVDQSIDIELKPYEPADKPYVKKARLILDRIKDVNHLPKKIEKHERKKCKFGTGILRVMYNKDLIDKIGCPEIKVCNPAYVYPDPNITNIEDLQESEFIIETLPKSLYWAEEKFGKERAWAIAPGYNPIDTAFVFRENHEANYDVAGDHYLHILYWCKTKEGKLRLIQMSGCGIVLSDTEEDPEYNYFTDDGRYPYFFTIDMEREGTIWGKSVCSLLFSLQDEIDDYTNMIRRNARLIGNPIKVVSVQSGIEIDKLDNTAGQVVPTNDINGMQYLNPPQMPSFISQRRAEAMQERVIISRVSDQQAGVRQAGVNTATESLNLAQAANVATDTRKTMLQDTLNDVFKYCFELALNYWNVGMFFQDEDDFEFFKPSDLKEIPMMKPATPQFIEKFLENNPNEEPPKFMLNNNEKRQVKFVFNIQVGAGLPTNKAVAFNYILEAYKGGLLDKQETRELLIEYIKLPVETVDNAVIDLEKKQIEYQSMMLDVQMQQMAAPQMPQMPQGNMEGIEQMQAQPTKRATAVANPRPNTLSIMEGEKNIV